MFCTQCGRTVESGDRFCQSCGAQVPVRVAPPVLPPQLPTALPADGTQSTVQQPQRTATAPRLEPLVFPDEPEVGLDWRQGMNGLLGYIGLQLVLSYILGRSIEEFVITWPIYTFYAGLWTVVFALGFSSGASWGIVIAASLIDGVLYGTRPMLTLAQSFDRVITDTVVDLLILGVVGLVRGRLEWIGLHNRRAVAKIFAWAGEVWVAGIVLTALLVLSGGVLDTWMFWLPVAIFMSVILIYAARTMHARQQATAPKPGHTPAQLALTRLKDQWDHGEIDDATYQQGRQAILGFQQDSGTR